MDNPPLYLGTNGDPKVYRTWIESRAAGLMLIEPDLYRAMIIHHNTHNALQAHSFAHGIRTGKAAVSLLIPEWTNRYIIDVILPILRGWLGMPEPVSISELHDAVWQLEYKTRRPT